MTPGFLAWVNTQKGHMPVGYPRGNADQAVGLEKIKHAILGYSKNRAHEGGKKLKGQGQKPSL